MERIIIATILVLLLIQVANYLEARCISTDMAFTNGAPISQSCTEASNGVLCPSFTVHNLKQNRKPKLLLERRCCTKTCAAGDNYACQEQYIEVRIKERLSKSHNYKTKDLNISVGCACMHKPAIGTTLFEPRP